MRALPPRVGFNRAEKLMRKYVGPFTVVACAGKVVQVRLPKGYERVHDKFIVEDVHARAGAPRGLEGNNHDNRCIDNCGSGIVSLFSTGFRASGGLGWKAASRRCLWLLPGALRSAGLSLQNLSSLRPASHRHWRPGRSKADGCTAATSTVNGSVLPP
jgi:hypothetical protein